MRYKVEICRSAEFERLIKIDWMDGLVQGLMKVDNMPYRVARDCPRGWARAVAEKAWEFFAGLSHKKSISECPALHSPHQSPSGLNRERDGSKSALKRPWHLSPSTSPVSKSSSGAAFNSKNLKISKWSDEDNSWNREQEGSKRPRQESPSPSPSVATRSSSSDSRASYSSILSDFNDKKASPTSGADGERGSNNNMEEDLAKYLEHTLRGIGISMSKVSLSLCFLLIWFCSRLKAEKAATTIVSCLSEVVDKVQGATVKASELARLLESEGFRSSHVTALLAAELVINFMEKESLEVGVNSLSKLWNKIKRF